MSSKHVLLYAPNLVGYFRICLLVVAWYYYERTVIFFLLYTSQALLDGVDGWVARKFNQTSKFGSWLDIVIDNIGRGIIWTRISSLGIFISSIEWVTMMALYAHGANWKLNLSSSEDIIVRNIMKNGFRTSFGFLTIVLGIHCLPIVMYVIHYRILLFNVFSRVLLDYIKIMCIIGRLFSLYCEIYVIRLFITEDLLK